MKGSLFFSLRLALLLGLAMGWTTPLQASNDATRILMLGDSITAGYGLAQGESLADQLEQVLFQQGYRVRVINGGVSGDTMSQGQARLEWLLGENPEIVIVALGANDALRGLPTEQMAIALDQILARLHKAAAKVLLVGMEAPRNYGPEYAEAFTAVYSEAVKKFDVAYYPFLLAGVALNPALNQTDGIHPNAQGAGVIATNLLPYIRPLLLQGTESSAPVPTACADRGE